MGKISIKDIQVGETYKGELLVLSCEKKQASNGPYVQMELTDGEMSIIAKRWRCETVYPAGYLISIIATCDEWQGVKNLNLTRGNISIDADTSEYLPHGPNPLDFLKLDLEQMINSMDNEELSTICIYALEEYNWKTATAAIRHHHAYIGGLLQHTYEVAHIALAIAQQINATKASKVNEQLVFAGALVHDIGKIQGYATSSTGELSMTPEGIMLEHMILGCSMIDQLYRFRAKTEHTSNEYQLLLKHIISSHHGKLEWGSPTVPCFTEAFIVHQADLTSSRVAAFEGVSAKADSEWSGKDYFLGTSIYKGVPHE